MVTVKKLRIFITTLVFLVALGILGGFSSSASAAEIGQRLTQPEEGWKRYDDTDPAISKIGLWFREKLTGAYREYVYSTKDSSGEIKLKFYGTKIRIIANTYNNKPSNIPIIIGDINESFSEYGANAQQILVYEKTDLPLGYHEITIGNLPNLGSKNWNIDAIDIDADGYLVSPDIESLELVGEVTNDVNSLSWNEIENATYNVKRATTAGGSYATIANELTTNSYIDSDVEEGVTYYYVVTAVLNDAESENSNEVALTREGEEPAPQPEPDGNAKLTLHLVDNQIKEYEVTLVEVDKFISWFDKRMGGTGQAYYVFELKHNISPYKTIKEYMVFDKIVWYEVKEY